MVFLFREKRPGVRDGCYVAEFYSQGTRLGWAVFVSGYLTSPSTLFVNLYSEDGYKHYSTLRDFVLLMNRYGYQVWNHSTTLLRGCVPEDRTDPNLFPVAMDRGKVLFCDWNDYHMGMSAEVRGLGI